MKRARRPATGVTAAAGFSACGVASGIRKNRLDLALIVSDRPASAAALFTRNLVQAAPVVEAKRALAEGEGRARAIVANSGNANACTGERGAAAARRTVVEAAALLGVEPHAVLVASTGVIGEQLPVERLIAALPTAVEALSVDGGDAAAEAILTTDTRTKVATRGVAVDGERFVVGGVAKGSGMIHPDMATTLAFVTTDAAVPPAALDAALRRAVDVTFNRITVDGETSTNDMVAVLANGAAGVDASGGEAAAAFERALTDVLIDLARQVVRDGEGATHFVTVRVLGAAREGDALAVARTISGSPLVKTAIYGADANWGRIVAAAGRAGVELAPEKLAVRLNGLEVLAPGYESDFSEERASELLSREEILIEVDLGAGEAEATTWTCDLTPGYVDINANYRT